MAPISVFVILIVEIVMHDIFQLVKRGVELAQRFGEFTKRGWELVERTLKNGKLQKMVAGIF